MKSLKPKDIEKMKTDELLAYKTELEKECEVRFWYPMNDMPFLHELLEVERELTLRETG